MKLLHARSPFAYSRHGEASWRDGATMLHRGGGMNRLQAPDCDVTVILRVRDDEERIGHALKRLASHLRALELGFEILVADEGSGDNTLAVTALWRPSLPELELIHAQPGEGYQLACERARGRAVVLYDARS